MDNGSTFPYFPIGAMERRRKLGGPAIGSAGPSVQGAGQVNPPGITRGVIGRGGLVPKRIR